MTGNAEKQPQEKQRQMVAEKMTALQSTMLRGTLIEKNIRCGNANCRCSKGHFHTAFYMAYTENNKTRTIHIPKSLVASVEEAIEDYREYKELFKSMLQINLALFEEKKRINAATRRKKK
jgi:hypothetical protein